MALLTLATAWACGGKAVVDAPDGSGGDGNNNTGGSTGNVTPLCATPDPVGELSFCGGSSGAGAGEPTSCTTILCDEDGNSWESECSGNGCRCRFNGMVECSCFGDGAFCGSQPSCCPDPFPE